MTVERPLEAADGPMPEVASEAMLVGFGNHFASEAVAGALPVGRNSPQHVPFGLFAEQISGTAFTAPRTENRRSWLYRLRPTASHAPFVTYEAEHGFAAAPSPTCRLLPIVCAGIRCPSPIGLPTSSTGWSPMEATVTSQPVPGSAYICMPRLSR